MRIHVRPRYQQPVNLSLEEVNCMLAQGDLRGDEPAWIPGISDWVQLDSLEGIVLPQPPPFRGIAGSRELAVPEISDTSANLKDTPGCIEGPKGIGGWLMLFCVNLTIVGPFYTLWGLVSARMQCAYYINKYPAFKAAWAVESCGIILILLYGMAVGWKIWGGSPDGGALAKKYLKIRFFGFMALEILVSFLILSIPSISFARLIGVEFGIWIGEVALFVVWWSYFKKSKRVKRTYDSSGVG